MYVTGAQLATEGIHHREYCDWSHALHVNAWEGR